MTIYARRPRALYLTMASSSLQVAGLASNFDWKSFVDSLMELEHKPADRLASEQAKNQQSANLLISLGTKLTSLRTAATDLKTDSLFGTRATSLSKASSTWSASASAGTSVGSYEIAVTQLATRARLTGGYGTQGIGKKISATDGSDVTLSTMATTTAVTAGKFTVEGVEFTVTGTESLKDVLDNIKTTVGLSDAYYDSSTDKVVMSKASGTLMLGASTDTSNFLQVLGLGTTGGSSVSSYTELGKAKLTAALGSGSFATAVVGDGSGNGAFKINNTTISYNTATDTLSSVLQKINDSTAGVTASYDSAQDKIVLTAKNTGSGGIVVSDTTGNLAAALNLTSGTSFTAGKDAHFTVNGGGPYTSSSNTLSESAHGITGLSVTVDAEETQTVSVSADTSAMRAKIESFVSKFNEVQSFLAEQTKITRDSKGKVVVGPLARNREIQDWARSLRSMAFASIGGLSGSISQLDNLGIDFDSTTGDLKIKDSAKLDAALANNSDDVAEFFQSDTTGFAAKFDDYLQNVDRLNTDQQDRLNDANDKLDDQIAAIERRLEQQRSIMESAFIAMENAQSKIKQQQNMLNQNFSKSSS